MDKSLSQGIWLAFLAYAAYALSDTSVKLLAGHPAPFEAIFFGAVFGVVALPFIARPGDRPRDIFPARNPTMWLIRAVAAFTGSLGSVTAFTHLSMAEAFSLLFLMPTFVTVLSVLFLGEQVGWRRWSAVFLGFFGVLVVLRPGLRPLNIGHLGAVVGGLSGAVTVVMLRARGQSEKRLALYGAGLIGTVVGALPLMLASFVWPSPMQWIFLLGYGVLAALANVLIMLSSAKIPATLVAPAQYSQMLWALILGALVFHSHTDAIMILGAAIIIASGIMTFAREKVRAPRGAARVPPVFPQ
jgi:drug/metabolite transporter (DMT)-like permease